MSVATSTAIAIAAGVGAAGSIGSSLIGANASGSAADKQIAAAEQAQIDLAQPVNTWACLPELLPRLWKQYSAVLATEIDGERADHLLWDGLEFEMTFATLDPSTGRYPTLCQPSTG